MVNTIASLLSYDFIVRAIMVGAMVSLCAALLGVSLVLKHYSMIGDGLAHVGFGALSLALALNMAPLAVAVPVVVTAAFGLLRLSGNGKIKGDAAIALISSTALAAGIIAASLKRGLNVDVHNYMFGSVLAISPADVKLSVTLSAAVLVIFALCYNKIFAITFDEDFSAASGIKTNTYNSLIALLTAVTIVVGMRVMGTLLISSLIVFPATSAMKLCRTFRGVVLCAAAVSLACFFLGMTASFLWSIPAGAAIVAANAAVLALSSAAEKILKSG